MIKGDNFKSFLKDERTTRRMLILLGFLVVLILTACFFIFNGKPAADIHESEPESDVYVISKPGISGDNKVDDELAGQTGEKAFYLSEPSFFISSGSTVVDDYIFTKIGQEMLEDISSLPAHANPSDNEPSSETEKETESESESEAESESDETKQSETEIPETEETQTEDSSESEPNADPRQTVWGHYPNLGVISAPNYLHIRTSPSLDGEIVGILFNLSGVNLLELSSDGQWYHIVSNGIEGYINAEFVITGDEAKVLAYNNAFPAVTVNAEVLNVRQEPNTDSTILTQIIAGSLYEVVEETNEGWLKIRISEEIEGYVSREFVNYDYALNDAVAYQVEPPAPEVYINPVRTDIVNNAMQYLGGRYVWGGTTLGVGVDCSGFMLRLFEQYGYYLPRTSYWQVGCGAPVSFEQMQPGDLIFYWNNNLGRIGHVAMYIGNNLIVHAASEQRGIVIDDYRFMTPYCARNIIGE